jgi:catechol 2,3-dioxygenase-like lactoylglutathione lyase family enzyme
MMPEPGPLERWYTRPVLFVTDMERTRSFYMETLDFTQDWGFEEEDQTVVCQLVRGGECEVILAIDAERAGKSRLFVSLNQQDITTLQAQIEDRSIETERAWWGHDVIRIQDPDGNELLFPLDEADGES